MLEFGTAARKLLRRLTIPGLLCVTVAVASGQTSGTLTGRVTDATGNYIPNASVTVTNTGTGEQHTTATNQSGVYALYDLLVGKYDISVSSTGFKSSTKSGVQLSVGDNLAINFQLEVGSVTESVKVTDATPLINTETADLSDVISSKQVTDLPLNGRAFTQLQQLVPGASRTGGDEGGTGFNSSRGYAINGQQEQATGFQVDGVENTDMGNGTGLLTSPGLEALGEMKVNTADYSAEYGNAAGASLLVVTRTGTDKFHGAAYEFFKNDALDARNYFATSNQKLRFNDFGYRIGGPVLIPGLIHKHKTFFFFAEEWRRADTTDIFFTSTPTAAMRSGDFSAEDARTGQHIVDPITGQPFPNDQIPQSRIDSNAALLLGNNFPLPTSDSGFLNYNQNAPDRDNWRQELLNVTHQLNDKIQLQVRYIQDSETHHLSGVLWSSQAYPNIQTTTFLPGHSFLAKVAENIKGNMLNEVTYDYASNYGSKQKGAITLQGNYLAPSGLGITPLFTQTGATKVPNLTFSGGWGSIDSSYFPWWAHHDIQEVVDNFSMIIRSHSIRAGGVYQHSVTPVGAQVDPGTQGGFNFTGYASKDPMADFLLGKFYSYTQLETSLTPSYNFNQFEAYVQDTWKATSRLTVNLGVRFFFIPHAYEANNILYNFVPTAYDPAQAVTVNPNGTIVPDSGNRYNGLISPGQGLPSNLVQTSPKLFGPRLGVAYDPTGQGRWSIRAGYGIGYYRVQGNDTYGLVGNPPNGNVGVVYQGPLANPSAGAAGALTPFSVGALAQHYPSPSVQSWSLNVQHQLATHTEVDLGYVGTFGTHSDSVRNINQPLPEGGYDFNPGLNSGNVIQSTIVPYAGFTNINMHVPGASTAYSGLQAHLRQQVTHGLFGEVSYTYSKTLSDASAFGATPQNSYNPSAEWSLSSYDRRHMFVANYVYSLPFFHDQHNLAGETLGGWQWTGIVNLQGGTPLTVALGTSEPGLANRPNLAPGARQRTIGKVNEWFDTSVYQSPAPGFFGQVKPYSVRGPGFTDWDTALFKSFPIKENISFLFRVDAFNVLNHPSWYNVNSSFAGTDSNGQTVQNGIGQVTSAHDPRILQLSAKFEF
jgi:Carboxypeptidase regulatory-like domain/TonB-dependent Receptor Plug Domain